MASLAEFDRVCLITLKTDVRHFHFPLVTTSQRMVKLLYQSFAVPRVHNKGRDILSHTTTRFYIAISRGSNSCTAAIPFQDLTLRDVSQTALKIIPRSFFTAQVVRSRISHVFLHTSNIRRDSQAMDVLKSEAEDENSRKSSNETSGNNSLQTRRNCYYVTTCDLSTVLTPLMFFFRSRLCNLRAWNCYILLYQSNTFYFI